MGLQEPPAPNRPPSELVNSTTKGVSDQDYCNNMLCVINSKGAIAIWKAKVARALMIRGCVNLKPAAEDVPDKAFNVNKAFGEEPEGHVIAPTVEKPEAAEPATDVIEEASNVEIPAAVSPPATKMEGTGVKLEESKLPETGEAKNESSEV